MASGRPARFASPLGRPRRTRFSPLRSPASRTWPRRPSPKKPSFEVTSPCYRFRGREPQLVRPPVRGPPTRGELPVALLGDTRLRPRNLARARRAPDRHLAADALTAVDERAADRGHPADAARRLARGAARRPSLTARVDDRRRSRPLRSLLRASVRRQRDDDRRAGRADRRCERLLPAGGLRGSAEPRRRRGLAERELLTADDRQLDLGARVADRRRARRGPGPALRLLGERGHLPALGGAPD